MGHNALYKAFPATFNEGVIQHVFQALMIGGLGWLGDISKGQIARLSMATSVKTEQGGMSEERYGLEPILWTSRAKWNGS